ncbi:glycoside hydrolase family 5 protein [Pontibacter sp. G13]|uniref:glycoside hydrolase family 5 protein n=1 Tax=Pontibacter sp. G13 TaxID=3074898 RepID=UPI00288B5EBC|nr:glycoside hydrolase family 5 protein [Pontibacter sp. G13]WNJ20209.1 glycoside hydrolase family 5 protein [Pontibacter sp. G13]
MKRMLTTGWILSLSLMFACSSPVEVLSSDARLFGLDMSTDEGVRIAIRLEGETLVQQSLLPFGTAQVTIDQIHLSREATSDVEMGESFSVGQPLQITVTAADGITRQTYDLALSVATSTSIVGRHGLLQTQGSAILNEHGGPISLAGNSFFWSNNNWGGERYYTAETVAWLKSDWNTTIVRASMGVEDPGGYLDAPTPNVNRVKTIVDAAIAEGIYVIIDWHSHHAEDHEAEAIAFFQQMATEYGNYPHVIYEIYNEPLDISWSDVLKPYAENVIRAIREIDPDNLIVVGTPEWSQRVDLPAADPITGYDNIAYTLHFYTVWHQQWLRDRAQLALQSGIPLFVTEWGSIGYTTVDPETDAWMAWCQQNGLSHCNWSVNDKEEEWSILKPGASTSGGWKDTDLTDAGKLAKSIISEWPE